MPRSVGRALLLLAVGCGSSYPVTRLVAGHRVEGRFVADQAYAAYLKGVVLETEGHLDAAAAAYEEAIGHDPSSAELWTRVGALRCANAELASQRGKLPWDAFTRAAEIDPQYEETWTERARCHLRRGELEQAARAARIATSIDPDRSEPPILLAQILERQGQSVEARQWLDGLIAREPSSVDAHEAMIGFAGRTHDEARREASERALRRLRPPRDPDAPLRPARPTLSEIDDALRSGELDRAEKLAVAAHLATGALALRATALGVVGFAREQAELVLAADPMNSDARVAALVAADLARDDAAFRASLGALPNSPTPLSPLARALLGELLERRLWPGMKRTWAESAGPAAVGDPLVEIVAKRR